MATAPRRSTGKAAPKTGAASAVSSEKNTTVTSDEPVTVDSPTPPEDTQDDTQGDRERLAALAAQDDAPDESAQKASEQLGVPADEGIPAAAGAGERPDPKNQQDLAALRALADTSGNDPVTPYPADGVLAPNPVQVLPPVRAVYNWAGEGEDTLTARVLADGWRARLNNMNLFARRGDRVTAPSDVIRAAAKHGIIIIEE